MRTAVINKRAAGIGHISGRKAFQRPMAEGVELLNAIQDVYLDESITVTGAGSRRRDLCSGSAFRADPLARWAPHAP